MNGNNLMNMLCPVGDSAAVCKRRVEWSMMSIPCLCLTVRQRAVAVRSAREWSYAQSQQPAVQCPLLIQPQSHRAARHRSLSCTRLCWTVEGSECSLIDLT